MTERAFLGTGWRFPVKVGAGGGLAWSSGERDVAEAIWLILATSRGERQMRPRFGCGMHDLVFASDSPAARVGIAAQVRTALIEWEPRIDVLDVRVDGGEPGPSSTLLLIRVDYRIRANNAVHNLVYPFYATEGAGA